MTPRRRLLAGSLVGALILIGIVAYLNWPSPPAEPPPVTRPAEPPEATPEQVRQVCAACHAYPPPETFPRSAWRKEVKQGYDFLHQDAAHRFAFAPLPSVLRYYEKRAPEALPSLPPLPSGESPLRFERRGYKLPDSSAPPGVTHLSLVRLGEHARPEVLVCDVHSAQVLLLTIAEATPAWRVLAKGVVCARAEVVDLDGDGIKDIVLACLGSFLATDDRVGSVVFLKGAKDGTFQAVTLLDGIGRVADVRAADFNGDGKLDLVVAVFGWRQTGEILYLENRTTDWSRPAFVPHVLDRRHGTTHVPVADLNGDGKPDFVALITQEHEAVVAFVNEGAGQFKQQTIWAAPHPAFGCNGLQLDDLDGDGDLDIVVTNGDALDAPYLLKPYHGVQRLDNQGGLKFPPHRLMDLYGGGSPVVADLDGDGRRDLLVGCFLPAAYYPQRGALKHSSLVWLQQSAQGHFVPHSLETSAYDHLTCAVGDVDGDGRPDLAVGNCIIGGPPAEAVVIWSQRR
jgi:hypothetical protein